MQSITVVHTIFNHKGDLLGEIFEDASGYGFYHFPTETEKTGFTDFESAEDAWHSFHCDFAENL